VDFFGQADSRHDRSVGLKFTIENQTNFFFAELVVAPTKLLKVWVERGLDRVVYSRQESVVGQGNK